MILWQYETPTGRQVGVYVSCAEFQGTDVVTTFRRLTGETDVVSGRTMTRVLSGMCVGERDPNQNRAFAGQYMVAEPVTADDPYPTDDASDGRFCIVGDDLGALVQEALQR